MIIKFDTDYKYSEEQLCFIESSIKQILLEIQKQKKIIKSKKYNFLIKYYYSYLLKKYIKKEIKNINHNICFIINNKI